MNNVPEVPPEIPEVPAEIWKELLTASKEFRKSKIWEKMEPDTVVGFNFPETGELYLVHIVFEMIDYISFSIYRGIGQLNLIEKLVNDLESIDWHTLLIKSDKIELGLGNKEGLDPYDMKIIKESGLKFRGKTHWPWFRDFKKGFVPWHIDEKDAKDLLMVLKAYPALMKEAIKDEEEIPIPWEEEGITVFIRDENEKSGWKKSIVELPEEIEEPFVPALIDEFGLHRIKKSIKRRAGAWDVGGIFTRIPTAASETSRPFFPAVILWVDTMTGSLYGYNLAEGSEIQQKVVNGTLETMQNHNTIPVRMNVASRNTYRNLQPVCEKLGIQLTLEDYSEFYYTVAESIIQGIETPPEEEDDFLSRFGEMFGRDLTSEQKAALWQQGKDLVESIEDNDGLLEELAEMENILKAEGIMDDNGNFVDGSDFDPEDMPF